MSMDPQNPGLQKGRKSKNQEEGIKIPGETNIKIPDLQLYISSVFTNCSMPPLNEFLELGEIENSQFKLKLHLYHNQLFNQQEPADYVYFLKSGKVFLNKINQLEEQTNHHNMDRIRTSASKMKLNSSPKKEKPLEIKQDSFFMLTSFKKISEVENFSVSAYQNGQFNKCLIAKIKINPNYSISWYLSQSQKHNFLSSFFQTEEFSISEHKLKGLCRFFKLESFRRGTLLTQQGESNQRLLFLKTGECQFSKTFHYENKNHFDSKVIKVANGGPRTVLGSQFLFYEFMGNSKSVSTATRALGQVEGKIDKMKLKLYDKAINNFTVCVLSGYAEVYHISVAKFKQLCEKYVPEVPQQLRKYAESNYITLLRTVKQKIHVELLKIERNQNKVDEQRIQAEARIKSGYFIEELGTTAEPNSFENRSPIKLSKSQFIQTHLQGSQVEKLRNKRLQKKIQLMLEAKKNPTDYKKKIEIVLKEKLSAVKTFQIDSPNKQDKLESDVQVSQIKKDLESIFMNNQDSYRTNSISRQNFILAQKQSLLKRRYSSVDNMLIVHQDHYDKNKNKLFRMDLIQRGLKDVTEVQRAGGDLRPTEDFSSRTRKICIEKINKANKIKQQFMVIRSECENCHCYDDIEGYMSAGVSHKGVKEQATKTGSAWKTSWESKNNLFEEPLEKLHSRVKLISERTSRKYEHNAHLLQKKKRFVSGSQRKFSAPLI